MNLLFFLWCAMMFIDMAGYARQGEKVDQTFRLPVLCLVLIMLLNDGCILTIAYDKVSPSSTPCTWKLGEVIIVAAQCGLVACGSTLLLLIGGLNALEADNDFYHNYWHAIGLEKLSYPQLQTMMYLAVSLIGFLTLFAARTRSFFFTRMVGTPLLIAGVFALAASTVLSATNFVGTVSGAAVSSVLPWSVIGVTWAYCLITFLVQDFTKVLLVKYLARNMTEQERLAAQQGLLRSSFWMVKSTMSVSPTAGPMQSHHGESLLAMARNSQTNSHIVHRLEEQVSRSVRNSSIISKGSLISASMTADPLAAMPSGKGVFSSVGDRSTAMGGSGLESGRPSSSLWGTAQPRTSLGSVGDQSSTVSARVGTNQ